MDRDEKSTPYEESILCVLLNTHIGKILHQFSTHLVLKILYVVLLVDVTLRSVVLDGQGVVPHLDWKPILKI